MFKNLRKVNEKEEVFLPVIKASSTNPMLETYYLSKKSKSFNSSQEENDKSKDKKNVVQTKENKEEYEF